MLQVANTPTRPCVKVSIETNRILKTSCTRPALPQTALGQGLLAVIALSHSEVWHTQESFGHTRSTPEALQLPQCMSVANYLTAASQRKARKPPPRAQLYPAPGTSPSFQEPNTPPLISPAIKQHSRPQHEVPTGVLLEAGVSSLRFLFFGG